MAGGDPKRRGGGLRLLAGLSVVVGAVTVLLSSDARRRRDGGAGTGRRADLEALGERSMTDHLQEQARPGTLPGEKALQDGFEPKDANTRSIAVVMVVAVSIIAGSIVGLFLMLGAFHRADARRPGLTAQQRAVIPPPGPPLQANPQYDLAALGKREKERLSTYAWLSPLHEVARIPIERAMAIVVGQPLDARPAAGQAKP